MDKVICKHYRDNGPSEYAGNIVQSAKYDPPHSIRMTTGLLDFPFRVIMEKMIISINGKAHKFVEQKDEVRIVKGSDGSEYRVVTTGGTTTCTCPGFQFRKKCKHTGGYDAYGPKNSRTSFNSRKGIV